MFCLVAQPAPIPSLSSTKTQDFALPFAIHTPFPAACRAPKSMPRMCRMELIAFCAFGGMLLMGLGSLVARAIPFGGAGSDEAADD